jgi:membrane-bound lytic murein transglycosylase D
MKTSVLLSFGVGILAGILILALLSFVKKHEARSANSTIKNAAPIEWRAPAVPKQMDFSGEAVPLDRWDVKEQLDREILFSYYQQQNILYLLKLANRYFPIIEERLKANGVPDDFKYLCVAESNLSNPISRVGATGFWQFMKNTAPGFKLDVTSSVDERYDLAKSTDAACAYLKIAHEKLGSWTAAAASYNMGMGGYDKVANAQHTKNYYDLLLNDETQRYIFKVLAFKYLMSHADELGFKLDKEDLYPPLKTKPVAVNSSIPHLIDFAMQNGTNYKILRWLNPWLKNESLTVTTGKTYTLLLPG